MHLLILGGTGEAAELAHQTTTRPGLKVTTSLAGETRNPARLKGAVRSGSFGGADGMADYLRQAGVDLVVDATHPFAAVISHNVAKACSTVGLPHVHLVRPPWERQEGDTWIEVDDLTQAAKAVAVAAPMPALAPVTRTVFPANSAKGSVQVTMNSPL